MRIRRGKLTPEDLNLHASLEFAKNSDGQKIGYWYIPAKKSKAIVILVHGYFPPEGGKTLALHHAKYLHDAGYTTVLVDLRAHGDSEGRKIFLGIKEWNDVESVYKAVVKKPETKHKKIGFFGASMGAVISLMAAGIMQKGDFVIAVAPYASLDRLFTFQIRKNGLPVFPFLYCMKAAAILEFGLHYDAYSPLHLAHEIHVPLLIFSAKNDETLNHEDSKLIFQNSNSRHKTLWEADAAHDIHRFLPKEFEKRVLDFLENTQV